MAQILTLPKSIPLSTTGGLMAAARLYTYLTATSTPQAVYTDYALSVAHANPVVADSNGVFPVMYWGNTNRYRLTLKTSADVTMAGYPVDDCGPTAGTDIGGTGFMGINNQTGNYTLVLADSGMCITHAPSGSGRVVTIPTNASVALAIGAIIDVDNVGGNYDLAIAATGGVSLRWFQTGVSGQSDTLTLKPQQRTRLRKSAVNTWDALDATGRLLTPTSTGVVQTISKAIATSRASTTTMASDPELSIALATGANYIVRGQLYVSVASDGTQGFKFQLVPSGGSATSNNSIKASGLMNGTATTQIQFLSTAITYGNVTNTGNYDIIEISAIIITAVAGTLALQWAQNTSNAVATTLNIGSYLSIIKTL